MAETVMLMSKTIMPSREWTSHFALWQRFVDCRLMIVDLRTKESSLQPSTIAIQQSSLHPERNNEGRRTLLTLINF